MICGCFNIHATRVSLSESKDSHSLYGFDFLLGKIDLDLKNYKGLKPTKINHKEGEEEFYRYDYTGKYLNNGEPIDFKSYQGKLPNFRTHKPVELQKNNLGYRQYVRMNYPPLNYVPASRAY